MEKETERKALKSSKNKWLIIFGVSAAVLIVIILLMSNTEKEPLVNEEPITETPSAPVENNAPSIPRTSNSCGDGICGTDEVYETCPEDCAETCGDGVVQDDENWKNCRYDLRFMCGDGICQAWEHYRYCSEDCAECIVDDKGTYQEGEIVNGLPVCGPSPRWVI